MIKIVIPIKNAFGEKAKVRTNANIKQLDATKIGKIGKKGALKGRINSLLLTLREKAARFINPNATK